MRLLRVSGISCLAGLLMALGACGGGGGGGSAGGPSSPPPAGTGGGGNSGGGSSPTVPIDPPPAPATSYAGNPNSAILSDSSVSILADTVFAAIMLALEVSEESSSINLPASSVIDVSFPGPQGGVVRVTGRINAGLGWIQYDLSNYRAQGVIWNGTQVFRRLQINNGLQDSLTEIHLHDLRTISPFGDVTLRGSITRRSTVHLTVPDSSVVTGTIQFTDNTTSEILLAEDIEVTHTPDTRLDALITANGRLYHGQVGWVDFSLDSPWGIPQGEIFPIFGGPLVATTETGAYFELKSLNDELVSLQYTNDPLVPPGRAARVVWPILFEAQTSELPVDVPIADAGASLYAATGTAITLDGAYSEHLQHNYLDYSWELLFRPPGSSAALDFAGAVEPTIQMDRQGRYLYRLEVSDGSRTSTDFLLLTGDDSTNNTFTPIKAQLPPDIAASTNAQIDIDLGRYTHRSFSDSAPTLTVRLVSPDGSGPLPQSGLIARFQPGAPGVYVAVLSNGDLSFSGVEPADFMVIEVDEPQAFAPTVSFPVPRDAGQATLGDLNADGYDDLVFSYLVGGGPNEIAIYYSNGTGFDDPVVLTGGEGRHVRLGDVSGDGAMDIVTTLAAGIAVFVQQADGSFGGQIVVPGNCAFDFSARAVTIADIDNDGRNDVIADGTCINSFEIYRQQADGSLAAAEMTASPGGNVNVAVGDLNDDGIPDLAVAARDGSAPAPLSVRIHYGQPGGTLAAPVYLTGSLLNIDVPALRVADMDGDGRDDLLFSVREQIPPRRRQIHVYRQDTTGGLAEWQVLDLSMEILDMQLADVSGDGRPDLILDSLTGGGLNIHYLQPDDRYAGAPARTALHFERESRVPPEAVGDVNGDGLADIAFTGGGGSAILLLGIE